MAKNKTNTVTDLSGASMLPAGIKIQDLLDFFDMANSEYAPVRKRMQLLDGADRSELWSVLTAKFPKYQVLPETNYINHIKESLLGSIYTVGRYAELLPKSQSQIEICKTLNQVLDALWEILQVSKYQRKAGERAALFNIGITQVGWDKTILGGTNSYLYRGDVVLKNIDPMKYMRDPYADCLNNAKGVVIWDDYHITTLKSNEIYKERLDELMKVLGSNLSSEETGLTYEAKNNRATNDKASNKYHLVQMFWMKYVDEKGKVQIAEIHLLDKRYVLYVNPVIVPNTFPFAELYCNEPGFDIIGASEPAKIFKNYVAYNLLESIQATHAYKAQRPPRFVNIESGINIRQFAQYGADADKTFPVRGDASTAVHYGKFPDLPANTDSLANRLEFDIKDKSGVTDQYTGKDTNSIQGTGGMDMFMARVTSRDDIKVLNYEDYTKTLTGLIIQFYIKYGTTRTFAVKDKMSNTVKDIKVEFSKIPDNIGFNYSINIQSELPRNKMRLSQAANILLEKQAQYKPDPEIITMEEWLLMQDIPFKDLIMDRLKIQRNNNMTEQVTQILFQFAGLIEQGVDPEEALAMVTNTMQEAQTPNGDMQAALGNQATAGSFQQVQQAPVESFQQNL